MRFKLLCCDVFTREISWCVARSPHTIDPVFTPKGEHNEPARLKANLQGQIDAVAAGEIAYDAVLLGYGLCGNAVLGLEARRFPVVIPRAHDCTTLFLGSRKAFADHFGGNPSQTWAAIGYAERGASVVADSYTRDFFGISNEYQDMVALYGEENAKYLMDSLRTEHGSDSIYFLDIPETRQEAIVARIQEETAAMGKDLRTIEGSIRLIEDLLSGDWSTEDFLVLQPGEHLAGVYDMEEVVRAIQPGAG